MTTEAGSGHIAGPMGIADVYAYLYNYEFVNVSNLENISLIDIPFILSCAHYAPVLYSTLIENEIIPRNLLMTLRKFGSPLQGHTQRNVKLGIYNTGGSLGQGLGLACGIALTRKDNNKKVYCQISDGECNEGSTWEAAMFAKKFKLDNLVVILDRNGIQQSGNSNTQMPLEPLAEKWESFGWDVYVANGNDLQSIHNAFSEIHQNDKPNIIIAYTTPGKGYSKIENDYHWHGKVLPKNMLDEAIKEIENQI